MSQDTRLSEHFSIQEATFSRTAINKGIDNTPSSEELDVMRKSAVGMERVRALLGNKVISISSWFRSALLNAAIGSNPKSQHRKGEAIDFNCFSYGTPRKVCELIAAHADLIRFDQLILENGWIHISFAVVSRKVPRKQVLTITPDGKTHTGLVHYE